MNKNKILIIDVETTGFSARKDGIVEIGIVELNLSNGSVKIIYDNLFNPFIKFPELKESWIIKNKFIDLREVVTADRIEGEVDEIKSLINSYPLGSTAFNNVFDFSFCEANDIEIETKLDCPMKILTPIMQLPTAHKGFKWPNVEEAYKYFFPKSSYIEKHRGADDAMHEAKIVYELFKIGEFKVEGFVK